MMTNQELVPASEAQSVISIRGLKKSFDQLQVLSGIDLDVGRGENVAILGKSGSGKSVLIKIISGLLPADSGSIFVLNEQIENISKARLQELRLKIGFSFQSSALYDSMTVEENLAFPLIRNKRYGQRKEIQHAIDEVLDYVQLPEMKKHMPADLSGGQKKRIGIARTLIMKPEIMLYDEPTAGLDPVTCIDINNLINTVRDQYKTASVIITHDLTCAKMTSNKVAMIQDGKILTEGAFADVFRINNPLIQTYYGYNFVNNS